MSYQRDEPWDAPEFVDSRPAPEVIHTNNAEQYPEPHHQHGLYGHSLPPTVPQYLDTEPKPGKVPRRIAGLPVWAFWLLIGVIGLVIIGASVGGAVGGSLNSKGHDSVQTTVATVALTTDETQSTTSSTSSSSSVSSTSSSAPSAQRTAGYVYTPATRDCPGSNGQTYTPLSPARGLGQYTFTKSCSKDTALGFADITEAYVASFDLCIDICSSWNYFEYMRTSDHPAAQKCVGAVFKATDARPGNCWIKNSSLPRDDLVQHDITDVVLLNDP